MISGDVNFLAVLIAAVVSMAIGAYWYSPKGFGKQWAELTGKNLDSIDKKAANKSYAMMFVASFVTAFVLANLVRLAGATTVMEGIMVGFWVWLGFVATVQIGVVLWDQKPAKLFYINTLYSLVTLAVNGAILALWA